MPKRISLFPPSCPLLLILFSVSTAAAEDSTTAPSASETATIERKDLVYDDELANSVQEAVHVTRRRVLDTNVHTPWQIMHGLLALRHDFRMKEDSAYINGLQWIANNPVFDNEEWFEITEFGGRAHPYSRPYAFEGHANQFFAIMSMSGLPRDFKFKAGANAITISDLIQNAKMEINGREEITWSLWALSSYLPPDAQWVNKHGEQWSIERLVSIQTKAATQGAPCGGTHGLFALAHARNVYLRTGEPLRGVWLEADYKIRRYIETARYQQNTDGTFSSDFFKGRAYNRDFSERMKSSGHILEFLMIAMPQDRLQDKWVRSGVHATARDLISYRNESVKCSPLYHALSGLVIYLERTEPKFRSYQLARSRNVLRTIASAASQPVTSESGSVTVQNRASDAVTTTRDAQDVDDAGLRRDTETDSDLSEARPKRVATSADTSSTRR